MTFRQSVIWMYCVAGSMACSGLAQPANSLETLRAGSVMPFSDHINSTLPEHSPVLSPDGRTLYFSRRGHPVNFGPDDADDIWISYRQEDGNWSRAINAGAPLNDMQANRAVAVNPAGNRIYLVSQDSLPTGRVMSCLYVATRQGRSWSTPQAVELPGYENHRTGNSFFPNADERILLYSAENSQSMGKLDLFVSLRQADGSWGPPVHLGPGINTPGDERHVVLAADEQTIYFSSDGHPGHGGSDIFLARRLDETWQRWSKPVNLGSIVNTDADDDQFSLSAAGNALVFVRNLEASNTELMRAALPVALRPYPVVLIQGQIAAANPLSTRLYYMRLDPGLPLPEEVTLRGEGRFRFIVPASTAAIGVYAVTDTGFTVSQCVPLAGALPGMPDSDPAPVMRLLEADSSYQQREKEIKLLQKQLSEVNRQLDQWKQQLDRYEQLSYYPLDTSVFDSSAVRGAMSRYQPYFDSLAAAVSLPVRDTGAASSVEEIRQRLRAQRLQAQAVAGPTPGSATEKKTLSPAGFLREVWQRLIVNRLPSVRREVESDLIRSRLEALQAGKKADSFQQGFLSEKLARLLTDTTGTTPGAQESGLEHWQQQLETELGQVFEEYIRKNLEHALRAPAELALETSLRQRRLQLHHANLQESLEKRLEQQISVEQKMMAEAQVEQAEEPELSPGASLPIGIPASFREVQLNIAMQPLMAGQVCTLSGVFFPPNSAQLLPVSEIELQRLADAMTRYPSLGVEIIAHSHNGLCHSQAIALTSARARAVAGFLSGHGINPDRIIARGAGKLEPVSESGGAEITPADQRICVRWFNL